MSGSVRRDRQNHISRSLSRAFTGDDFDGVTDCFHPRQQFVFMLNCKITERSDDTKKVAVSGVIRHLSSGTSNKLCAESVAT